MANKFVISVADAYIYDKCAATYIAPFLASAGLGQLNTASALFVASTLTDSSIDTTISNADTRGGFGNQLLNVYYHSAEMSINFTDAKFNLMAIKSLVGDSVYDETTTGNNIITISSSYVPKTIEAILVAKIAGSTAAGCTGVIGNLVIHVPAATLDGAVNISMTADGVSTTPFKARALAAGGIYASLYEFGAATTVVSYGLPAVVPTALTWQTGKYYIRSGVEGSYTYALGEPDTFSGAKTYYVKFQISFALRA